LLPPLFLPDLFQNYEAILNIYIYSIISIPIPIPIPIPIIAFEGIIFKKKYHGLLDFFGFADRKDFETKLYFFYLSTN
jgi:hypothetical protein